MSQPLRSVALVFSLFLCCRVAIAATVDFTFTGTGINGWEASGAFSIDDAAIQPISYGQISPAAPIFDFSLTVTNFPGGGTTSVSLDPQGSYVFFGMDSGGIARIIPGASFTFPSGNYYQLTANTNFYAPPFTPYYHSVLDFVSLSRVLQDDITWGPAVLAAPEPDGDYNFDGSFDAADYVVWRKTDGILAGYNVWRDHFGGTNGSGARAGANAAVPEPATLVLLMFASAGWCLQRCRAA